MSSDQLLALAATIKARRAAEADGSYTRQLLDAGVDRCAKKFGEEALETVIAATMQSKDALAAEAADALYHLLVLLECRDVSLADVFAKLEGRKGATGLAEKAARDPAAVTAAAPAKPGAARSNPAKP